MCQPTILRIERAPGTLLEFAAYWRTVTTRELAMLGGNLAYLDAPTFPTSLLHVLSPS